MVSVTSEDRVHQRPAQESAILLSFFSLVDWVKATFQTLEAGGEQNHPSLQSHLLHTVQKGGKNQELCEQFLLGCQTVLKAAKTVTLM